MPQTTSVAKAFPDFPPVKPDKLHNYEIGAKADLLDRRVSFDAALYYINWKGVQQSVILPVSGGIPLGALLNGPSASGLGVDFGATVRPLMGLELSFTGGWNDLKMDGDVPSGGDDLYKKGDRLSYSPEFTGAVSGTYDFSFGGELRGRFTASGNYISKQKAFWVFFGGRGVNTGDSSFDIRAAFSVLFPTHWTATLFANNLTDDYGGLPTEGFPEFPIFTDQNRNRPHPRTIGVQFDYKY
jgi:outer membrane receptor protein involved in Fe transport